MPDELLKNLLRLKIASTRKLLDRLPQPVQKPLKSLETELLEVVYAVSKEYVEQATAGNKHHEPGAIKSIDIK